MPHPRPIRARPGAYDDPPSSETSTPRSRRDQLERALRSTHELTSEATRPMDQQLNAPRRTLLSPVNRRRRRSPSTEREEARELPEPFGHPSEWPRWRRSKRTRLDTEPTSAYEAPIKYGYYGQVEPGRLKLDLISCDGGEHTDPHRPGLYLGAKNLLQHNKSVYCSTRPTCNIILRHADNTPFCLEKLHVVGPEDGFTAPVREGLVYVAMTLNDLQRYLRPSHFPHPGRPPSPPDYGRQRRRPSLRASPERLTLVDALRDPEVDAALSQRLRGYPRDADTAYNLGPASTASADYYGEDFGFGRMDPEAHCEIPITDLGDQSLHTLHSDAEHIPVTVLSDEDVGPEEASTPEVLDFRRQRERLMRRRYDTHTRFTHDLRWGEDRDFDMNDDDPLGRSYIPPPPPPPPPMRPMRTSSLHRPFEGADEEAGNQPNVTFARFRIRHGKYKVAMKFDPPISGRFILLKLWAGTPNVDVQSVIAKGYGGCRFFPAREWA